MIKEACYPNDRLLAISTNCYLYTNFACLWLDDLIYGFWLFMLA